MPIMTFCFALPIRRLRDHDGVANDADKDLRLAGQPRLAQYRRHDTTPPRGSLRRHGCTTRKISKKLPDTSGVNCLSVGLGVPPKSIHST
jgi:hypothetical protein